MKTHKLRLKRPFVSKSEQTWAKAPSYLPLLPSIRITHRLILTQNSRELSHLHAPKIPLFGPGTPNCKRPPNHRSTQREYRSQCGKTRESQAWLVEEGAGGLVACWLWLVRLQCLLWCNIHLETTGWQWIEIRNLWYLPCRKERRRGKTEACSQLLYRAHCSFFLKGSHAHLLTPIVQTKTRRCASIFQRHP